MFYKVATILPFSVSFLRYFVANVLIIAARIKKVVFGFQTFKFIIRSFGFTTLHDNF